MDDANTTKRKDLREMSLRLITAPAVSVIFEEFAPPLVAPLFSGSAAYCHDSSSSGSESMP